MQRSAHLSLLRVKSVVEGDTVREVAISLTFSDLIDSLARCASPTDSDVRGALVVAGSAPWPHPSGREDGRAPA